MTVLLPLALDRLLPWTVPFVVAYVAVAALILDLIVERASHRETLSISSANNIVRSLGLLSLMATLIAFHAYTVVGEDDFPAAYILGALIVAATVALFAIVYIQWRRDKQKRHRQSLV